MASIRARYTRCTLHTVQQKIMPLTFCRPACKLRVCITGAGGFVGRHLARRLKSEGHYIIACGHTRIPPVHNVLNALQMIIFCE